MTELDAIAELKPCVITEQPTLDAIQVQVKNALLCINGTTITGGRMSIESRFLPAAQYLRMSTEHQQYSIQNQKTAIQEWAALHRMDVVATYADEAKSGVRIENRDELKHLLADVSSGKAVYEAILVYDVSRWGRFPDNDEAAHYEFICKAAGIPVYYCNEPFANDGTVPSLILKALKRTMAAEYSRDLGERVRYAIQQMAQRGFKMGASPGFALQRVCISQSGKRKRILPEGEYKGAQRDRVILVPGPKKDVECVREMFDMVIRGRGKVGASIIARRLNERGMTARNGREWNVNRVLAVLRAPKYCGRYIWGKTTQRLYGPRYNVPASEWIVIPNAITPIIPPKTFERAQQLLRHKRQNYYSKEEIERRYKRYLQKHDYLSEAVMDHPHGLPAAATVITRYGTLRKFYERIGYKPPANAFTRITSASKAFHLRQSILEELVAKFPAKVKAVRYTPYDRRRYLLVDGHLKVNVVLCRSYVTPHGKTGWHYYAVRKHEDSDAVLLCLFDPHNSHVQHYFVLPQLRVEHYMYNFRLDDQFFIGATQLKSLEQFYDAVWSINPKH